MTFYFFSNCPNNIIPTWIISHSVQLKNILPLDEGVRVINTLCEKIITLDFVSGDNFPPRVLIYPNTFIQVQLFILSLFSIVTL